MTTIDLIPGEVVERDIPNVGHLVFEDLPAGGWLTKTGELAKKPRRRYLLDGIELVSVTTVQKILHREGLIYWAEKEGIRGGVVAHLAGELDGVPEDEWCQVVRSLGLGAMAKRDEGAARGTAIHTVLHRLALGVPQATAVAGLPEQWEPWVHGALAAWAALEVEAVLAVEQIVCNPQCSYAGRFDLLARVGDEVILADWKTSLKGVVYPESHTQVRAYAECLHFDTLPEAGRAVIVAIKDDGSFELVESCATLRDWYAVLDAYQAGRRLNAAITQAAKTARAERKAV